jgi:hypothetical protein
MIGQGRRSGTPDERGLLAVATGDGVGLLLVFAGGLVLAGGAAVLLGLSGEFLPHELRYLGMTDTDLCRLAGCRVTGFMRHDRVAFGGALVSAGTLYGYTALFPLRAGQAWSWWLVLISGSAGFLGFPVLLGHGYLDTWHALGTLALLAPFVGGLVRTRRLARRPPRPWPLGRTTELRTAAGLGRLCLLVGAGGVAVAGLEILRIGVMEVFVPEDLHYIGGTAEQLAAVNAHLVPVIAHDRAGFGAAVLITGLTTAGCLLYAPVNRALWQALLLAGAASLTAAIGVHLVVGYVHPWHLTPPVVGVVALVVGLVLTRPRR